MRYLHYIPSRAPAVLGALLLLLQRVLLLRTRVATAFFAHPSPLLCATPQSQPQRGPPDDFCPAKTATAICLPCRRCFPFCPTRLLHLPAHVGTCHAGAESLLMEVVRDASGLSSPSRVALEKQGHDGHAARAPAHQLRDPHRGWVWVRAHIASARLQLP